ncbi:flavocytochrome c [Geomonas paludis]|uniref:Fumarate reductase n=1 Tax=Geomonas paludis TaxID=2740185 RepID=A0A6V8MQK1_9BACT|nr:flavocytochrome c [Geomonas paludis]UPU36178.1 flavocytochrome c [Geomonas paludis]GFO62212.1 fumarate reductase flavoprotein subunit [Geomonas paludis]
MTRKTIVPALLLSAALLIAASAASGADSSKSSFLSGVHKKNQVTCADCHGKSLAVDDSETALNKNCKGCHGGFADLAAKTKEHINPHNSHLGETNCTACHKGHAASKAYCNYCHSFAMKIPAMGTEKESTDKKWVQESAPGKKDLKSNRVESTDVVVIGAGGSGYVASITAHDAGARVILLEKMPITGGNSMLAAGGINAARTRYQERLGMHDDPAEMVKETMKGGRDKNDPELVKVLAYKSADAVDFLVSLGADMTDLVRSGGVAVDRTHRPVGGAAVGPHLIKVYRENAAKRNLDVRVNSEVVQILSDGKGRVTGVQVKGKHSGVYTINAKAVIDTAGGFAANNELVGSYKPQFRETASSNQPGATGEGMFLAEKAGAKLIDMEQIQIHPTMGGDTKVLVSETVRGSGAILVNHAGKRFVNELTTRDKASAAILAQPEKSAFLVLGESIRKSNVQIDGYITLGLVQQADSIAALAAKMGVPADALTATVTAYNKAFEAKKDPEFQRQDIPRPVDGPKYYAIWVKPGRHHTMGGVKINTEAQVIGKDGNPVTGFYAAGEVTGGVHGWNRLGGNAITDTVVFGRIAGSNAASFIKKEK